MMKDVFCSRPQYRPGEPVCLIAEREDARCAGKAEALVTVRHLNGESFVRTAAFLFPEGSRYSDPVEISVSGQSGFGYSVSIRTDTAVFHTAFDVFPSDREMPRYGFMCRFTADGEDGGAACYLLKHHITWVQFYDWMYRHEQLLPPEDDFTDLMGRSMNIRAVEKRVDACLEHGIRPIAYGAVYAASVPFADTRPDWMLYDGDGNPLEFIGKLRYMDISPGSPWRKHIEEQFAKAAETVRFSGIHLDTYGFPKNALTASEEEIALQDCFGGLIDETREHILSRTGQAPVLVFNNVGNWPVDTVAGSAQDALYIEVWPPYERYQHLMSIIGRARALAPEKPLIIAAYAKAFITAPKAEAWKSALVLQSVLAASGAHALLLGENNGILTQAYYPDYYVEDDPYWLGLQRAYSDFTVQWQELLYSRSRDVSYTHALGDNREYRFFGAKCGPDCRGGEIGFIIREMPGFKVIHLIDLRSDSDLWQEGKTVRADPIPLTVKALALWEPKAVFRVSPEADHGLAGPLPWRMEHSADGLYISMTVRISHIWEMIVIET